MWLRLRRLLAAEEGEVIVGRLKYLTLVISYNY
jgi:hypothetical protein